MPREAFEGITFVEIQFQLFIAARLEEIQKESSTYKIIGWFLRKILYKNLVFEDVNTGKLIAHGAIILEKKFIIGNSIVKIF